MQSEIILIQNHYVTIPYLTQTAPTILICFLDLHNVSRCSVVKLRIRSEMSKVADYDVYRTIELNKTVEQYSYVLISKEISSLGPYCSF